MVLDRQTELAFAGPALAPIVAPAYAAGGGITGIR
jgi:hypothetical protein